MGELFANDRIKNIQMEFVQLNDRGKDTSVVLENDLIFARRSILASGAGKYSIILEVQEITTFESHLIRVRLNQEIANPLFYYYYFKTPHANIKSIVQQGVQAGIRGSELKDLEVIYPPLIYQNKIASILSTYDDLIEDNLRQIKLFEEIINIKYKNIVDKVNKDTISLKLNSIVDIIPGYPFKSTHFNENGKYKIVTIKNVQDGFFMPIVTDKIDVVPSRMNINLFLNTGDIIMSLTGNVGRVCLVYGENYVLNQRVVKVHAKNSNDKSFVYAFLRDKHTQRILENLSTGTAQQNLSPIKMGELLINYPTKKLRREFNQAVLPIIKFNMYTKQTKHQIPRSKRYFVTEIDEWRSKGIIKWI
ncbi:MAG: restriction endonuclease subunit S [Syntrophothermus sp.]